jgi:hypothetical protein
MAVAAGFLRRLVGCKRLQVGGELPSPHRRPGLDPGLGFLFSALWPEQAKPRVKHGATIVGGMSASGSFADIPLLAKAGATLPVRCQARAA